MMKRVLLDLFTLDTIVVRTVEHVGAALQFANFQLIGLRVEFGRGDVLSDGRAEVHVEHGVGHCDGTTIGALDHVPLRILLGDEEAQRLVGGDDVASGLVDALLDEALDNHETEGFLGSLELREGDAGTLFESLGARIDGCFHGNDEFKVKHFWHVLFHAEV